MCESVAVVLTEHKELGAVFIHVTQDINPLYVSHKIYNNALNISHNMYETTYGHWLRYAGVKFTDMNATILSTFENKQDAQDYRNSIIDMYNNTDYAVMNTINNAGDVCW